ILAPDNQRYEVANYGNVTIPTNLDVKDSVRDKFGEFYAALFDRTLAKNPGAVVTEYAWSAGSCDPCPGPTLDPGDLATLGGDVVPHGGQDPVRPPVPTTPPITMGGAPPPPPPRAIPQPAQMARRPTPPTAPA